MPVRLNRYRQDDALSTQDRLDLDKLYQDYPLDFSASSFLAAMNDELAEWFAGRFNDRLIAGVLVKQQGDSLLLDYLCVRKVTRLRRVASDLLRETIKAIKADPQLSNVQQLELRFDASDETMKAALHALLSPYGFTYSEGGFRLSL